MKAIDLKIPYTWKTRAPYFGQRLLYVPEFYQDHEAFSADDYFSFLNEKEEIIIEYCSGNGQWILEQAAKHPEKNFIAVEKRFDRAKKIWRKIHTHNLPNLIVVLGDGREFSKHYLPEKCISSVYINFPDPWPKKRHEKNRIMQPFFINQVKLLLKNKGNFYFSTDHKGYLEDTKKIFLDDSEWTCPFPDPYHVNDLENYGTSFFDTLFRQKKESIYYLNFIKNVC
jgi:tRNA (guanine-N7-)-methyltransferase